MCAQPPCEERGEDKYFWKPSSDGSFSIKSAYQFPFAGIHRNGESIWKALWKWPVQEKIKAFMWIFAHGRAHTVKLRMERGLVEDASCRFGCNQEEDSMHLSRERWISVVSPTKWDSFSSLQGAEWVHQNLKHEVGRLFTGKLIWSILFGYICRDICVTRCSKQFREDPEMEFTNAHSSFFRACWDQDLMTHCHFHSG